MEDNRSNAQILPNTLSLLLVILVNLSFASYCQSQSEQPRVTTQLYTGISIQKFALQQWVKPTGPLHHLGAEQNPEGFGLEMPIEFFFNHHNFGLLGNPILRYDITKPLGFSGPGLKQKASLFVDFHISVYKKLEIPKYFKQPLKIGVGYSFISPFLAYENPAPNLIPWREIKLDFAGPHILLCIPVYKFISIKQQLMYVPQGQIMYWNFSEALMYHLIFEANLSQLINKKLK